MAKTAYSSTPMCILASREHTCIHPKVSKSRNKNDDCKKLRDYAEGVSCSFFHRVQQKLGTQSQLRTQHGYNTAWDIEDLVKLGRRVKACPYFALRGIKDDAEIIFCPYNYLIDPMIREQMLIDVKNKVIILDEAHNMEDSAREAASLSLTQIQLSDILKEITELLTLDLGDVKDDYKKLHALCAAFVRWIDTSSRTLPPRGYEQAYGIWNGVDFLPVLEKELGLTEASIAVYERALLNISEAAKEEREDRETGHFRLPNSPPPSLSISYQSVIKNILIIVGYLFKKNKMYIDDYRIALLKIATMARPKETSNWMSKRRRSQALEKVWTTSLNFWCLNPAVAFSDLTQAHSIVLTSGTLSPMTSFSSELGVNFPIQLEAAHVIPESQTWVNSISHGPSGLSLIANYQNSETYQFQDEVGEVVLRVCQTVPYGVLCFFSSYKMLEKLTKRWQSTGMWNKIDQIKCIFSEPRSGHKEDFEDAITSYYRVISDSRPSKCEDGDGEEHYTGALFLAVCRGKVSEGLDFADNNARAVITIGIPFPNIKDKQVELKREYNNSHCHGRGVLTGSEWYEIQAYRALNQALGRCIRHKKDWGALILIDERYSKGHHYTKGLSKWIRHRIHHQSDFDHSMRLLQAFTESMMTNGDSTQNPLQSSLLKSPSTSVSLGVSMSSPSLPGRNMSINALEHPGPVTPQITVSEKIPGPFKTGILAMPRSPDIKDAPHTSTPISSYKSAPQSLRENLTVLSSTPCSSHTPTNADATVNYGVESNNNTLTTCSLLTPKSPLAHHESKHTEEGSSLLSKPGPTLSNQSHLQSTFIYPSNTTITDSLSVANESPNVHQIVGTEPTSSSDPHKNDSVIIVEESPPSSVTNVESKDVTEPKTKSLEHTDSEAQECAKDTNESRPSDIVASTLTTDLKVLDSERSTSPVLFDTPGSVGGLHTLLKKLSNVRTNRQSPLHHSIADCGDQFDNDKTPPISPENETNKDIVKGDIVNVQCELKQNKKARDGNSAEVTDPNNEVKTPPCKKVDTHLHSSRSHAVASTSVDRHNDTALGQPKTRRGNTRRAKKRCVPESSTCSSTTKKKPSRKSLVVDDDDFVEKTPKKLATVTVQQEESTFNILCSCKTSVSKQPVTLEKVELKDMLSSRWEGLSNTAILSSKLWTHLKNSTRTRAKTVHVIIVNSSELDCSSKQEEGVYNAVWDENLSLCYDILQCTHCKKRLGISVHSSNDELQCLVGKAIIVQNDVTL